MYGLPRVSGWLGKAKIKFDMHWIRPSKGTPMSWGQPENALNPRGIPRHPDDPFEFNICDFKPYVPHFDSDFCTVDHEELIDIQQLRDNVKVVSFHGDHFVYKFMDFEVLLGHLRDWGKELPETDWCDWNPHVEGSRPKGRACARHVEVLHWRARSLDDG